MIPIGLRHWRLPSSNTVWHTIKKRALTTYYSVVNARYSFLRGLLVEEVPAYAESEYSFVKRIVGCEEVVAVALACIDMAHHHEEAGVLQVEVGINVHQRIVAHLSAVVAVLYTILSKSRTIVGCLVLGEVACVGTEVALQNPRNLESQIQIGVDVEVGHRYDVVVGRFLICHHILPTQRTELEVLL